MGVIFDVKRFAIHDGPGVLGNLPRRDPVGASPVRRRPILPRVGDDEGPLRAGASPAVLRQRSNRQPLFSDNPDTPSAANV